MMNRRPVAVAALLMAALALTSCASKSSTATSSVTGSTAAGSTTSSTAIASGTAIASSASDATSPAAPSQSAPTGSTESKPAPTAVAGRCSSLDQKTAESMLGFATAAGISSPVGVIEGGLKKLDGCTYVSKTDGALGYDVVQASAQLVKAMIGATKSRMAQVDANVTKFDVGLPDSVSFTQAVGAGVDSQVNFVVGDKLITVSVARRDGNVARAQASVTAAAKQLATGA